jgi:hypothetical protein
MRILFLAALAVILIGCRSSATRAQTASDVSMEGKVYLTKRPLLIVERSAIYQTSFETGKAFFERGGQDEAHAKALLVRRQAYHYRVVASKLKDIVEKGFEDGAQSAGETSPGSKRIFRENALKALHP